MRAVKTRRLYVAWSVLFSIALFGQQKDLCGNVRCAPKITTLTGRTVQVFEDEIQLSERASRDNNKTYTYWKPFALSPGVYRLDIVLQDVIGKSVSALSRAVRVNDYDLSHISSLVLTQSTSDPVFHAIEEPQAFAPKDNVHPFVQVYDMETDPKRQQMRGTISYEVFEISSEEPKLFNTHQ